MILSAADMLRQEGWKEGWRQGWKEGWRQGWKEGWQEGRQQGLLKIQQKVERIAIYLLQKGIDIETVMEATQLNRSKLERLRSNSTMDTP